MELFKVAITSAFVATVVGALIDAWRERRRNRRSAKLDALNIAVSLEGDAIKCADRISDHKTAQSSDGYAGRYMASLPNYPELPVTVGILHPRKAALAARLAAFPQEVEQADQAAAFWWDVVADIECARQEATNQGAAIGLKSIEMAEDIRRAFRLPARNLVFGKFNVRTLLEEEAVKQKGAP